MSYLDQFKTEKRHENQKLPDNAKIIQQMLRNKYGSLFKFTPCFHDVGYEGEFSMRIAHYMDEDDLACGHSFDKNKAYTEPSQYYDINKGVFRGATYYFSKTHKGIRRYFFAIS